MAERLLQHIRSSLRLWWLFATSVCAAAVGAVGAADAPQFPPYTVEGTVVFEWYTKAGTKTYPPFRFSITVDGCKWFAHEESDDKSLYDYNEVLYDGRLLYSVHSLKNAIDDLVRRTGTRGASNVATAAIYEGDLFRDEFAHAIGPVWLAYASGCYWRKLTNALVEPVTVFTSKGPRVSYRGSERFPGYDPPHQTAFWRSWPETPWLPEAVSYLDGPFTNCAFRVLEATNLGILKLPLEAVLLTFWGADQVSQAPADALLTQYRIRTSGVRTGTVLTAEPPLLPGLSAIADYRFAKKIGFLGLWGSNWPSEQVATNSIAYAERVKLLRTMAGQKPPGNRTLPRILIACALLAPLVFLAARPFLRKLQMKQLLEQKGTQT